MKHGADEGWGDVEHLPPLPPERKPEGMNPLLAETLDDWDALTWPQYATPKIDGMRALTLDFDQAARVGLRPEPQPDGSPSRALSVPVTRNLKPIGNDHVRRLLSSLPPYLDGELWIDGARNFGEVSGPLRRASGKPSVSYLAFDYRKDPSLGYLQRVAQLVRMDQLWLPDWVQALEPDKLDTLDDLAFYEERTVAAGFEGVMLRRGDGRYKFGRSTLREGILLKLKRFSDAEALVVGTEELLANENAQTRSETGHAKRSSSKEGLRPRGTLGALLCRTPSGIEFSIGSGFTEEQRAELWARRGEIVGELVTYKFQPHGAQERPRFPIFKGLRSRDDA
jgi:ATP-dependent DNA ligase